MSLGLSMYACLCVRMTDIFLVSSANVGDIYAMLCVTLMYVNELSLACISLFSLKFSYVQMCVCACVCAILSGVCAPRPSWLLKMRGL